VSKGSTIDIGGTEMMGGARGTVSTKGTGGAAGCLASLLQSYYSKVAGSNM